MTKNYADYSAACKRRREFMAAKFDELSKQTPPLTRTEMAIKIEEELHSSRFDFVYTNSHGQRKHLQPLIDVAGFVWQATRDHGITKLKQRHAVKNPYILAIDDLFYRMRTERTILTEQRIDEAWEYLKEELEKESA